MAAQTPPRADAPAPAPAWEPRVVAPRPPALGPPYTLGEDVLSLPPGALARVLDCLTTVDAAVLRSVSVDAEMHVAGHRWADADTPVWDLAKWRASFPRAIALRLPPRRMWVPHDVVYLTGLEHLVASGCDESIFAPSFLAALGRIPRVMLIGCKPLALLRLVADDATPASVADGAFEALKWVRAEDCSSWTISPLLEYTRRGSPRACEAAVWALHSVVESGGVKKVIETGGLRAIVAAMTAYPDSDDVFKACCETLDRISGCRHDAGILTPGMTALAEALQHRAASAMACEAALLSAAAITNRDQRSRRTFAAAGGIERAVAVMTRHAASADVVGAAVEVLANLTEDSKARADATVAAGGVPAVVNCLRRHVTVLNVYAYAGTVLSNVVVSASRGAAAVAEAGGAEAILAVLQRRPDDDTAVAATCWESLRIAAASDELAAAMHAAGGIALFTAALRDHAGSPQELSLLLKTLAALVGRCPPAGDAFAAAGGIERALEAMTRHADDDAVATAGCAVLCTMAEGSKADAKAVVAAGGVAAVIRCLRSNLSDPEVCSAACIALGTLAHNACQRAAAMVEAGSVAAVMAALRRHPDSADVVKAGLRGLRNLARGSPPCAAAMAASGGLDALLAGLRGHVADKAVCKVALSALIHVVGPCKDAREAACAAGMLQAVIAAAMRHRDSADLLSRAAAALNALALGTAGEGNDLHLDADGATLVAGGVRYGALPAALAQQFRAWLAEFGASDAEAAGSSSGVGGEATAGPA